MTDFDTFTGRSNEQAYNTISKLPIFRESKLPEMIPEAPHASPPSYNPPKSAAKDSLTTTPHPISQRHLRSQIKTNAPVRRISTRAVGRPTPLLLTRSRSRQNLRAAHLSSPSMTTIPRHQYPESSEYTLELDLREGHSQFMFSPRMQGLVTKSYADLKSRRRVSRRKSNTSMRSSSASDRLKSTARGDFPPIPSLPLVFNSNDVEHHIGEETGPLLTMSAKESTFLVDRPASPPIKRVKESRYHLNAPPPLQLKTSSHRPRSKRLSTRRISRDARASIQSIDSSLFPMSPLTPRPRVPSKKEQQRRRLLKLKRTLGEEVPLELITPTSSSGFSTLVLRDLGAFAPPESRVKHNALYASSLAAQGTKDKSAFGGMSKRKKAKNMLGPLGAAREAAPTAALEAIRVSVDKKVSTELPPRAPSPPIILISHPYGNIVPPLATFDEEEEGRSGLADLIPMFASSSLVMRDDDADKESVASTERDRSSVGSRSHWPRTPFAHAFQPLPPVHLAPPSNYSTSVTTAKRSERRQGWSGEWNQPDMQDVIAKLRNM